MFLAHQMVLLFLSLQKPPPLITSSFLVNRTTISSSLQLQFDDNGKNTKKRRANSSLSAMEKESHFELDPDKAKEALAELDQQLQSLAQKQVTPSKDRVSSSNLGRKTDKATASKRKRLKCWRSLAPSDGIFVTDKTEQSFPEPDNARDLFREEMPELSGSFLAYSAFALFMFTVVYNIIFITVIKPSVDGGG